MLFIYNFLEKHLYEKFPKAVLSEADWFATDHKMNIQFNELNVSQLQAGGNLQKL